MTTTRATNRREFLVAASAIVASPQRAMAQKNDPEFAISLVELSLQRTLRANKLDHLDFAGVAKQQFGIDAVQYATCFFPDKSPTDEYLAEMNKRAADHGVRQLVIVVHGEGRIGDPDPRKRTDCVRKHFRWIDAAKTLGCHSIQVLPASAGSADQQRQLVADGVNALCDYADKHDINILLENYGEFSSSAAWLLGVLQSVKRDRCGAQPNLGRIQYENVDRTIAELIPFARAVTANTSDFDREGNDMHTDYIRIMKSILAAGFRGYVGIAYEGQQLGEYDGIRATKQLLERVRRPNR